MTQRLHERRPCTVHSHFISTNMPSLCLNLSLCVNKIFMRSWEFTRKDYNQYSTSTGTTQRPLYIQEVEMIGALWKSVRRTYTPQVPSSPEKWIGIRLFQTLIIKEKSKKLSCGLHPSLSAILLLNYS